MRYGSAQATDLYRRNEEVGTFRQRHPRREAGPQSPGTHEVSRATEGEELSGGAAQDQRSHPLRVSIRARAALAAPLAIAALLVAAVVPASARVVTRHASLDNGSFSEFDETNQQVGSLKTTTTRPYDGQYAATATYSGGGANGFSR